MQRDAAHLAPVTRSPEHIGALHELLSGYRVSQALYVVARLGVADLLADGPMDADELAHATATHAPALGRVLRFLAAYGLFDEVGPHRFALTALGAGLRSDVTGSPSAWALLLLAPDKWQAWGALLHTVQTGETAFDHVHGMGLFEYLSLHPEDVATFQAAMSAGVAEAGTALAEAYDFGAFARVVDVGGGQGATLAAILRAHPRTRGVLFDRPEVVSAAPAVLQAAGVNGRCEVASGDFFVAVPPDGDVYQLRQIIHDWSDEQAIQIMRNCRAAIRPGGRLLVIERAVATDLHEARAVLHADLEMMVGVGGAERTEVEYAALFAQAGFRLSSVVPLRDAAQFSIFEGVPA